MVSVRGSVARHTSLTNGWKGLSRLFGSCAARSKLQDESLVRKLSPHFHFVLLIGLLRPNPKEMCNEKWHILKYFFAVCVFSFHIALVVKVDFDSTLTVYLNYFFGFL